MKTALVGLLLGATLILVAIAGPRRDTYRERKDQLP